jgi:PKD repeat protein
VCLTVLDACGADSTCQTVVITTCVNPVADFTSVENPAGSGTFDFTNTSTTTGTTTYAWDFGDSNTDATENPSHTYASGGTYTVVLTVTDSCGTNSFTGTVSTSVGVNELSLAHVSVYPNPSSGVFSIEASMEMETAYITDLSGKLIFTGELSGNETVIDAEKFASGTYFLSIRFADGMIQTIRLEVVK